MRFESNKSIFLPPLKLLSRLLETRTTLENQLRLFFEPDALHLMATDGEIELRTKIVVENFSSHLVGVSIAVHGKKCFDIIQLLPDKSNFSMTLQENQLLIQAERIQYQLMIQKMPHFSPLEFEPQYQFSVSESRFKELLDKTFFAMGTPIRPELCGLLLELKSDQLVAVTTDGHRLAIMKTACKPAEKSFKIFLSHKTVMELRRLSENHSPEIHILLHERLMRIQWPDLIFTTKLLELRFPDYEKVVPTPISKPIRIETDVLKSAIARVAVMIDPKSNILRLSFQSHLLQLTTHQHQAETASETVEIDYEGESRDFSLNLRYLQEILTALRTTSHLNIFLNHGHPALLIQPAENENIQYLIMPMR